MAANTAPVPMLVIYRPATGKAQQLEELVLKHGPTLSKLGLITKDPVRVFKASDKRGHGAPEPYFIEMFTWRDGEASNVAHQTPEVMAVWETMGPVLADMTLTVLEPLA